MELSKYQQDIIDWALHKSGHGCCNAVAGSGKSTTLKLVAKALEESGVRPGQVKICVFGKANSLDLISKFGKAWESSISTLHSTGWGLLKKHLQIKNPRGLIKRNKYKTISQDLGFLNTRHKEGELKRLGVIKQESDFMTLIDLVRLTNQSPSPEVVEELCAHFDSTPKSS